MDTKTYSEQRQEAFFRAARELRGVACQVLDDMQNDVELSNPASIEWAKGVARKTAETANELETRGHEETIASSRAETGLRRSREHYSAAIDAFEARIKAVEAAR